MSDFAHRIADVQNAALSKTDRVLGEVRAERAHQLMEWGWGRNEPDAADTDPVGFAHDDGHLPGDWTRFIVRHLGRAEQGVEDQNWYRWRDQMKRVAALAVAAIEAHDRQMDAARSAPEGDDG